MNHIPLRAWAVVLPAVLLAHAAIAWSLPGTAPRGTASRLPQTRTAAMQLVVLRPRDEPVRTAPPLVRDDAPKAPVRAAPEPAAPRPAPGAVNATNDYVAPTDLDRAALPRSAPDISLLEGLSFSGLPMRLRLFVDPAGKVDDVAVLQANDDADVVDRVRQMFLRTAFVAGRRHGVDVASYKDVELTLGLPQ